MRPTLILKEMFVAEAWRGLGVGRLLFDAVRGHANRIGASYLKWTVVAGNEPACAFYRTAGAQPDGKWEPWVLPLDGGT